MQQSGESDANTCAYNDFALVKVDPADVATVDSSVPGFGGPTGLGPSSAMLGDTVYTYGNSSLRGGVGQLSPKQGTVVRSEGGGWSRTVYTVTPGVPGDSGSGFMSDSGQAIGTLSTLQVAPTAGSNGVADLRKELSYAQGSRCPRAPARGGHARLRAGPRGRHRRRLSRRSEPQLLAQDLLHDLVGAAADGAEAGIADGALDAVLAHVAVAPVDLQALVGDLEQGALGVELRDGHVADDVLPGCEARAGSRR